MNSATMHLLCTFILFGLSVPGFKAAHWSTWGTWGQCSVTCGTGISSSHRSCVMIHGHELCDGSSDRIRQCLSGTQHCPPVDGNLTAWTYWSHCSATCEGTRRRTRVCYPPKDGGAPCRGNTVETSRCGALHCPVNGGWSTWQTPSKCSVTCGGGVRTWTRTCNHPTPANGGHQCQGESHMSDHCNENPCPVNGVSLAWGDWSPCSVTCGSGSRVRARACSSPQYGGHNCTEPLFEINNCSQVPCQSSLAVNGGWSRWRFQSRCSVTCGGGVRTWTRTCTRPTPANGGHQCQGESHMSDHCNENPCPVNGDLSAWGNWSPCSVTCGSGSRVRARACSSPQYRGHNCTEPLFEINNCSHIPCQSSPAGAACPTCTENVECTWNTTCHVSENCMVRSIPRFKFTTHCILKDDCFVIKMLAKTTHEGEVFCCADEICVRKIIG